MGYEEKRGAKPDFMIQGQSKHRVDLRSDGECSGRQVWGGRPRVIFWTC